MTKFGQLVTATIILLLIGSGIYWFVRSDKGANSADLPEFDFTEGLKSAGSGNSQGFSAENTYQNEYWGFSFSYAEDFQIREIDEDNGAFTVLGEGTGEKRTFQIFVADFDEAGPITPERIRKDLPDKSIEQAQFFKMGDTDALAFVSQNETGKSVEVWFVGGGALYQISSYFEFSEELSRMLATWKFD